jgi:hypothetical protein
MTEPNESPPRGQVAGVAECSLLGGVNGSESAPNPAVVQAKIGLLREDIVETIGPMIATLQAAVAMGHVPNDAGLIYGLRTAQAYWRSISWSARELQRLREGDLLNSEGTAPGNGDSHTGGRQ